MRSRTMLPFLGALALAVGCDDYTNPGSAFAPDVVPAGTVVLERSIYEGDPGDTTRVRAFVVDARGRRFALDSLTWSSQDSSVAVVHEGRLYLVQSGETQLAVEYNGTRLTAAARASNKAQITKVDIFPDPLSLTNGETRQLGLYIRYSDGKSIENTLGVNWSSTDPSVASVTGTGVITAHKVGKAKVIAKRGKFADTVDVSIVETAAEQPRPTLSIAPDTAQVAVGATFTFSTALSTGEKSPSGLTWSVDDPTVASVAASGELLGRKEGMTAVYAKYGDQTVQAVLRVVPAPVEEKAPEDPAPSPSRPPAASDVRTPELPREFLDTRYVAPSGRTINVPAGGNLQAALNDARDGDEIVLAAGATYKGNFTLPRRSTSNGWVTIRTSALSQLPAEGVRVSPSNAGSMPKIVSANNEPAIRTAPGASGYRLVGLEVTYDRAVAEAYTLVAIGSSGSSQDQLSEVPTRIVLDRMYVHGNSTVSFQRCVALNAARAAVIDSYLSDCHAKGFDSQAIATWNGPGPIKIVNNYLEAAGENVMFGGADPSISQLVPSDIEIRGNHFFKPLAWQSTAWTVKNLFELKNAQRVLVEGNVFENNWVQAQTGYAILFQAVNQSGGAPWSRIQDVTFRHNIVRNSANGFTILSRAGNNVAEPTRRVLVENNVLLNIGDPALGSGGGRALLILGDLEDLTVRGNTMHAKHSAVFLGGGVKTRLTIENNIFTKSSYGLFGDAKGEGKVAFATYAPDGKFLNNVLALESSKVSQYPTDNAYPARDADIGFVNLPSWDLRLSSSSPYRSSGANWDLIQQATRGVVR